MNADYIFVADINDALSETAKRQKIQGEFSEVEGDRIIVVIKEIESWYLAGLDDANSRKLGIHFSGCTDNVTKEQFNSLIPKKFDSRIDFMSEVLKRFSLEMAKQKNKSFKGFLERYNCKV